MAKAKLKTAKDNEYDAKPDKRGNRRSGARDSTATKEARKPCTSRSKPSESMTLKKKEL
jgi:hypothetical protein